MRCRRPLSFAPLHAFRAGNVRPRVRITCLFVNLSPRMWYYMTENARKSAKKEVESACSSACVIRMEWEGGYIGGSGSI